MTSLGAVLTNAGVTVSERRFAELVEQALSELGRPGAADPGTALAPEELAALTAIEADLAPRRPREADARAAAAAAYAALLAEALPVSEVARRLGIDPSRVRHRLKQHRLIGIRRPDGWLLPTYQFGTDGRLLPGIERVAEAVMTTGSHPVSVARFLATAQPELVVGRRRLSPREWLESGGDPAAVVTLARSLDVLP
ncbi:MAG TPA: DNA-binding protein [Mycobacteriales bacterium]|jgi:hypothetical protein|nr:DNA-binding protein [Mycobacteriales bacterium]